MAVELIGRATPGECLVASRPGPAYRAALPPALLAGVYGFAALTLGTPVLWIPAAVLLVIGLGRAALWYRCGDDSLWDDGQHLIWSRAGAVVTAAAWADLRSVTMESSVVPPEWRWGDKLRAVALPEVYVQAATPPAGNTVRTALGYRLGSLVLVTRRDVESAGRELAAACERHGVRCSWWRSGRRID